MLELGTSALLILWEDLWARPLAEVIRGAGGVIAGGGRIAPDVVEATLVGPMAEQ